MTRSLLGLALVFLACGHASPTPASAPRSEARAHDSVSLQALKRAEDERFARAAASEPVSARLEVERVSASVLVDRTRGLAYVLRPHLVALDLERGVERWKLGATGTELTRLGPWLVVLGADSPKTPHVAVVAPDTGREMVSCPITLPLPPEAEEATIIPFDRAGAPHLVWRSAGTLRRGGTPHSEAELRRYELGISCGVAALELRTCALTPANLRDFLMQPARDYGGGPASSTSCRTMSPGLEMPAVAASTPSPLDPRRLPSLRVVMNELPAKPGSCSVVVKTTLEAHGENDKKLWQVALPDVVNSGRCPGPP